MNPIWRQEQHPAQRPLRLKAGEPPDREQTDIQGQLRQKTSSLPLLLELFRDADPRPDPGFLESVLYSVNNSVSRTNAPELHQHINDTKRPVHYKQPCLPPFLPLPAMADQFPTPLFEF